MPTIGMNSFASRHTSDSRFSHFEGDNEELLQLAAANFDKATPGYRDGVVLVPVSPERFRSGVVEVTADTPLQALYEARAKGEAPYISVVAVGGEKLPAKSVNLVLYRHDVLAADGDATTELEWEIVSINASTTEGEEPMSPMAMARNMLGLAGGTAATYTAEQFAKAIVFWSTRAMRG